MEIIAKRESCTHEWIEKKTEYAPSEFGDRIEQEKYCEKCGDGKYHRYCEFNNKENKVVITEYNPDWWGEPLPQGATTPISPERAKDLLAGLKPLFRAEEVVEL